MQYQGENNILSRPKVWILLFVLLFPLLSFAQIQTQSPWYAQPSYNPYPPAPPIPLTQWSAHYIVPDVCVERAVKIGVFTNKDAEFERRALRDDFDEERNIDFSAIDKAYSETLDLVSQHFEDSESDLFQILIGCKKDEADCHGKFKPTNSMHVQLYCDAQIYQELTKISYINNHDSAQKITKKINRNIEKIKKANERPNPEDDAKELQELQEDIALAESYAENVKQVKNTWSAQLKNKTMAAIKASPIPEGYAFILEKSYEEFEGLNYQNEIEKISSYWINDLVQKTKDAVTVHSSNYQNDLRNHLNNLENWKKREYFFKKYEASEKKIEIIKPILTKIFDFMGLINKAIAEKKSPGDFLPDLEIFKAEFDDWATTQDAHKNIERHYSRISMMKQFQSCCDNTSLLADYEVSASYVVDAGKNLEQELSMQKMPYLTFQTSDYRTNFLLDQAEGEHWKKRFSELSPLDMTAIEQEKFFNYYKLHPFFFRDKKTNTYQAAKKVVVQQRKDPSFVGKNASDSLWTQKIQDYRAFTEYRPDSLPSFSKPANYNGNWFLGAPIPYRNAEFLAYQDTATKSPNYRPIKSMYPDDSPYGDPRGGKRFAPVDFNMAKMNQDNFMKNIIFDPMFSSEYSKQLQGSAADEREEQMSAGEKQYYRELFEGFVPYAFGRAAKAKIFRELQKYKKSVAEASFLKGDETKSGKVKFRQWSQGLICDVREYSDEMTPGEREFNTFKKYVLKSTYCAPAYDQDRKKTFDRMYDIITNGEVFIRYLPEGAPQARRNRLFDQDYLNRLDKDNPDNNGVNPNIKAVNQFCWDNHSYKNSSEFTKDPQKATQKFQSIEGYKTVISRFFRSVGEEAMGQTNFADILQFNPGEMVKQCFTRGYVFGDLELGYAFTPFKFASSPFNLIGWQPVSVDKVNPSKFQLTMNDMILMENGIERKLNMEFRDLDMASRKVKVKDKKKFLEESASFRTLSMIEYALDHPSENIGKYICRLIMSASDTEEIRRAKIEFYRTLVIIAGVGLAVVLLPVALAGTVSLMQLGAVAIVTAVDVYQNQQLIGILERKNDLLDQSMTTGSFLAEDALQLHAQYNGEIKVARIQQVAAVAASALFSIGPIKSAGRFLNLWVSNEGRFHNALRMLNLEHYARASGVESKYLLSKKFTDFFTNLNNVSKSEAAEFMALLNNRKITGQQIQEFIAGRWATQLGDIPALVRNEVPTWFGRNIGPLVRPITAPIAQANLWTKNVITKPIALNISRFWYKFWYWSLDASRSYSGLNIRAHMFDELAMQTNIARTLNKAQELSQKTGRNVFSAAEIEKLGSKLTLFVRENNSFVRIFEKDFLEQRALFMAKQPLFETNPELFESYMRATTDKDLMMPEEWIEIFNNPAVMINTESELKSLLKGAKFSKRGYTGIISKLTSWNFTSSKQLGVNNMNELFNLKEISGSVVYRKRGSIIRKNIDRFMEIDKTLKYRSNFQTRKRVEQFAVDNKLSKKEITQAAEKKMKEYGQTADGQSEKLLERLESVERPPENMLTEADIPARVKKSGLDKLKNETDEELFNKYQRQFWDEEELSNEYFQARLKDGLKRLKNNPNKAEVFSESYLRAAVKASQRKTLMNECTHPTSVIRSDINKLYKKLLIYVSMGASAYSYEVNHSDEPHDMEWLSRISFDVLLSYFINKTMMKPVYSSTDQSPLVRDFIFYPLLVGSSIGVDGVLYQNTIQRAYNSNERYRSEFANLVFESSDLHEKLDLYFSKHPELLENMLGRIGKLEEVFETIKSSKPGDYTEQDAKEIFVKTGLIESYFPSQAIVGTDYHYPNMSMYQAYVDEGLIETPLFSNKAIADGEVVDEEIIDIMTDIVYQNVRNHGSRDPEEIDGSEDGMFFDAETKDRMKFNAYPYEFAHMPLALAKNNAVFQAICYGRYLPAPASVIIALGAYTTYKIPLDLWKFSERDKRTGH